MERVKQTAVPCSLVHVHVHVCVDVRRTYARVGVRMRASPGHGVNVTVSGIDVALGMLGQWASTYHPDEDLWHLLTDCFPAPGRVGLATLQVCRLGVISRLAKRAHGKLATYPMSYAQLSRLLTGWRLLKTTR